MPNWSSRLTWSGTHKSPWYWMYEPSPIVHRASPGSLEEGALYYGTSLGGWEGNIGVCIIHWSFIAHLLRKWWYCLSSSIPNDDVTPLVKDNNDIDNNNNCISNDDNDKCNDKNDDDDDDDDDYHQHHHLIIIGAQGSRLLLQSCTHTGSCHWILSPAVNIVATVKHTINMIMYSHWFLSLNIVPNLQHSCHSGADK